MRKRKHNLENFDPDNAARKASAQAGQKRSAKKREARKASAYTKGFCPVCFAAEGKPCTYETQFDGTRSMAYPHVPRLLPQERSPCHNEIEVSNAK